MTSTLSSVIQIKGSRTEEKHNDDETKKEAAKENVENTNERKRRHDSGEYLHDDNRRRQKDDYHIGSRYWGGDDQRKGQQRHGDRRRTGRRCREDHSENERDRSARKADIKQTELNTEDKQTGQKKKKEDTIMTKTGGAYIPPAKLRMMQAAITDKSSVAFQRLAWEALKKSIHGLINKVNISNIGFIVKSLIKENIIRGKGLLCRSIIQAQAASPTFTHVFAALVAIINSKFPNIGELLLTRLILQFRRGFRRNDKQICLTSTTFIAHLVNQQVAHEILALEILTLLLENATDDSVEMAVGFLKECGQKLGAVSPRGLTAVFDRLRHVLHEAELDKRVKYMIEVMFQVRKDGFKDNPAVIKELDLVEEEDQFTHMMSIQEAELDPQDSLNVFKHDPQFENHEEMYQAVKKETLGDDFDESSGEGSSDQDGDESEEEEDEEKAEQTIVDETETNLTALRRTIYLTIQSSLDHNECAHKMMKIQMKPGQEMELCCMILDCCAQQRTYEKFFGLLAQRLCQINKIYIPPFEQIFRDTYDTVHRLDTNKLRNVAKMFAHLLFTDAISWNVLSHIKLNEEDTTSSSRVFLKILFQELSEYMGLGNLNLRLKDSTLQSAFEGIFPRDDPRNTRFAINFFTSIGLGGLTDELREHLRTHPKPPPVNVPPPESSLSAAAAKLLSEESDSDSSTTSDSSSSSSSSSSSTDSSSTDSSSSEEEGREKKKRKTETKEKRPPERYPNKGDEFKENLRNRADQEENHHNQNNELNETRQNTSDKSRGKPRHRDDGSRESHRHRDGRTRERYRNRDDGSRERHRNRDGGSRERHMDRNDGSRERHGKKDDRSRETYRDREDRPRERYRDRDKLHFLWQKL